MKTNKAQLIKSLSELASASGAPFHPTRDPANNLAALAAIKSAAVTLGCARNDPWIPKRQRNWHQLASAYVIS